jgi:hypothetical protein
LCVKERIATWAIKPLLQDRRETMKKLGEVFVSILNAIAYMLLGMVISAIGGAIVLYLLSKVFPKYDEIDGYILLGLAVIVWVYSSIRIMLYGIEQRKLKLVKLHKTVLKVSPNEQEKTALLQKIISISNKINETEKLKKYAILQSNDETMNTLIEKQTVFICYLYEYIDKYQSKLLILESKIALENMKDKNSVEELDEIQNLIIRRWREIKNSSPKSIHTEIDSQCGNLKVFFDSMIRDRLISATQEVISSESPVQQISDLKIKNNIHDLFSTKNIDLTSLDKEYDRFIAELDIG